MQDDRVWLWSEVRRFAEMFMRGEAPPVETAVALAAFRNDVPESFQETFDTFVVVSSETDAIPTGDRRAFWHADVRETEDRKHDQAQAWARPLVERACSRLLADLPDILPDSSTG